jgi:hypothetical protein
MAITAVAVLLLGIVFGLDHARLSRLEKSVRASEHAQAVNQLSTQYASLASDVRSLEATPRAASEASLHALKAQWEARVSALEQGALACASAHDLAELADRMDVLETRLQRAQRKSATIAAHPIAGRSAASASPPSPTRPDPPFLPLGIELRGGERFLTIVPTGGSSIANARALRPGDREGAWILERLELEVAEFRVEGQVQRLSVPK